MTPNPVKETRPRGPWAVAAAFAGIAAVTGLWAHSRVDASPATAAKVVAATPVATEAVNQANQLSDAFASVAEHVSPSVVTIKVESKRELPQMFRMPFFFGQEDQQPGVVKGSGSGVIFRSDGAILTNNHVVEHATRITVVTKDGRSFHGKVLGTDPAVDLAVVKIDAKGLPAATFADSSKARVGDWVLAIGAPFGLNYTLTAGILSAKGRGIGANEIEDYLQTDASINPGNSGGPLVDLNGHVLGINTMIINGSGIGFAIPGNLARQDAEQLLATGKVKRAWLGVSFQALTSDLAKQLGKSDTHGALVSSVVPQSPAAKAGLKPGDVIEKVDSTPVNEDRDLLRAVIMRPVNSEANLLVLRDGKESNFKVTLSERPNDLHADNGGSMQQRGASTGELGLQLQSLTPEIAQELHYQGDGKVIVAGVRPSSPADAAGIERGDVIVEADRHPVRNPEDVANAARDGKVLLRVERGGNSFFTVLSKD